ncbi:NUDIX hydrolase [Nocardiopsis tropica]|uniref:NUDIX hydrolase n=1 Tax=Nocardiopsis tropica TaxID=109330 RepID=A0ABV1ZRW1_9ACTN
MQNDFGSADGDRLPEPERWKVLGNRPLYSSPWIGLDLVKVVPPGREPYEHHVARVADAVGVVLRHPDRGVLLLHRYRFITDTSGFEIPAGALDEDEGVEDAAAREVLEETGWTVRDMSRMLVCNPSDGVSDQRFHFVLATADEQTGEPVDAYESSARVWFRPDELSSLLRDGKVPGALTSVALLHALHFGML